MRRRKCAGKITLVLMLTIMLAVYLVTSGLLFNVSRVVVNGVTRYSVDQIMAMANIRYHDNVLALDEQAIRSHINQCEYLEFVSMEKSMTGTVVLNLRQREPRANIMVGREQYILDEQGMVLSMQTDPRLDNGLITITGVVPRAMRVGSAMICQNNAQLSSYREVLREILAQNCQGDIAEINLSTLDAIYYITTDGFAVRLGDTTNLRVKIGTARGLIESRRGEIARLTARGEATPKLGGTIVTTVPQFATFTPAQ